MCVIPWFPVHEDSFLGDSWGHEKYSAECVAQVDKAACQQPLFLFSSRLWALTEVLWIQPQNEHKCCTEYIFQLVLLEKIIEPRLNSLELASINKCVPCYGTWFSNRCFLEADHDPRVSSAVGSRSPWSNRSKSCARFSNNWSDWLKGLMGGTKCTLHIYARYSRNLLMFIFP